MSCSGCAARDEIIEIYQERHLNGCDAVREMRTYYDQMHEDLIASEKFKRELFVLLKQSIECLEGIVNNSHPNSSAYAIASRALEILKSEIATQE